MTPKTPQCEVFWALLLSSKHSGVMEDSQPPTFPSVGLHPHTWPKWGCDNHDLNKEETRKEKTKHVKSETNDTNERENGPYDI